MPLRSAGLPRSRKPEARRADAIRAACWRVQSASFVRSQNFDWIRRSGSSRGHQSTDSGVMPAGFRPIRASRRRSPDGIDLWTPIVRVAALEQDPAIRYGVVMHLRDGIDLEDVNVAGTEILSDLRARIADWRTGPQWRVGGVFLRDHLVGESRSLLTALFGAVGFLLLLATANLANLQLARDTGRVDELSLLRTLGASAWRVTRRLLTEAAILGFVGSLFGLVLAVGATQILRVMDPAGLPMIEAISVDPLVVLLTAALGVATGLALGCVTAGRVTRRDAAASLRRSTRSMIDGSKGMAGRRFLVALEAGLVVVLLVGAGLMGRSLVELGRCRSWNGVGRPARLSGQPAGVPLSRAGRDRPVRGGGRRPGRGRTGCGGRGSEHG